VESWYWGWGWLHGVEEVALRVVPWLRRILSILGSSLSRRLPEVVPKAVLLAQVDLCQLPSNFRSSVPFSPLVFRVRVVERIAHLRYTISAVCDVKRCITLLEMFRKRLGVCRRFRPLRFVGVQLEYVLPLNFDAITVHC
jgi:hypothetical protein